MEKDLKTLSESLKKIGICRTTFYTYLKKNIILKEELYQNKITKKLYLSEDTIKRLKQILTPIPQTPIKSSNNRLKTK